MKHRYTLSLADSRDIKRICGLLAHHAQIMRILNEDSKRSLAGGAAMTYEVKIELEEKWS